MNALDQVTNVRGYAKYLGLDPTNRSVLRKIQRQCERGELPAKLDGGTWKIKLPHAERGELIMKNWESLREFYHDGMVLIHAGYGNDPNYGLNNNKISQFYVNQAPIRKPTKHFAVTWDFNEFKNSEAAGSFEWPSPHAALLINYEQKQRLVDYFSGSSFVAYGRSLKFNDMSITILNRPVKFGGVAGSLRYYAGAVDADGNVYEVFWNMFNIFDPVEIVMTVDKGRYCKHCLTRWMLDADTTKCKHEWVQDTE
ncbi:hypothetical protein ABE82_26450 (plasmid) [Paenibacillus peoriae]|uniref:hypothetical protein n=1 Tax=Paenibacillus peoriae TaxID=59893 RepID=UPI000721BD18|nr:hypothetical protein [Paenibacillus peoriae]ALS09956.1 hypothetical protein ABE82_26450 [Paenibacillus peoriae]